MAVNLKGSQSIDISNSLFKNVPVGIKLRNVSDAKIHGNVFEGVATPFDLDLIEHGLVTGLVL